MGHHSVADAKNQLSKLIDLALAGEGVTITRHGRPVVELRPVSPATRKIVPADVDWLVERRVGKAGKEDAGTSVRRMRDEDWR
jgi:prevent-host-death family protein